MRENAAGQEEGRASEMDSDRGSRKRSVKRGEKGRKKGEREIERKLHCITVIFIVRRLVFLLKCTY